MGDLLSDLVLLNACECFASPFVQYNVDYTETILGVINVQFFQGRNL